MTDRVLIVGTGLMGGSLGLALREAGGGRIVGFDRSPEHVQRALELGAIDEPCDGLSDGCAGADVIVIATPVGQILATAQAIAAAGAHDAVVTDVGSTKGPIVEAAERALGPRSAFVGGHPMAGSEREGIEAARADLFRGALWILTPTPNTDAEAFRRVHGLVSRIGAKTLALDPAEHDRLVALVSHLPYALATALMELAGTEGDERVFRAAAGSFRDVTRTAGSNPRVWRDILAANRDALLVELDAFTGRLAQFRDALHREDWAGIEAFIDRARAARQRVPLKGERGPASPVLLEVPVADRAGVLAEITTAIGGLGINIEDLWMEHEGAGGIVRLVLDGTDAASQAAEHLRAAGLHVLVEPDA